MSSLSAVFLLLSVLLFSGIQAEARDFPGMSFNNELIVVNIGGGIILNPPALSSSLTSSSPSSVFEILSGIIRWFMSQAPLMEQQQVVDQINCENNEPANPCNKLLIPSTLSDLFTPTPPVKQSVLPPLETPPSTSLPATPYIPRTPHHEKVHPPPIMPSSPSLHATPCIPRPPHETLHPSPILPPTPSLHATPYIPPPKHESVHPSPILPPSPSLHATPFIPLPPHETLHPSDPILPSIISISEMMVNGMN